MVKVPMITYVVVGFRVDQAKSCYYAQTHSLEGCMEKVADCFAKAGAQFASIRVIPPQADFVERRETDA